MLGNRNSVVERSKQRKLTLDGLLRSTKIKYSVRIGAEDKVGSVDILMMENTWQKDDMWRTQYRMDTINMIASVGISLALKQKILLTLKLVRSTTDE